MTLPSTERTSPRTLFLIGFLMGCADLIPGISGGTVAFVSGIYDSLLRGLKTFPWGLRKTGSFFLPLGLGIGLALLLFSPMVDTLLSRAQTRSYLYSFFAGSLVASLFLFPQGISAIRKRWCCLGALLTAALSLGACYFPSSLPLVLIGVLAASAMLLPGVSGSYVLLVFGKYDLAIRACARVVHMLRTFSWDGEAAYFLLQLGVGICLGFACCSRLVQYLLHRYREATLSFLLGCVAGGVGGLWPFRMRAISFTEGNICLAFFALAFALVLGMARKTQKRDRVLASKTSREREL